MSKIRREALSRSRDFRASARPLAFQAVRVVSGSVEWPGELDLSYETLYVNGQPTELSKVSPERK